MGPSFTSFKAFKALEAYIDAMCLRATWFTYDGGRTLYIWSPERSTRWDGSYEWGEEVAFERLVRRWLDNQPWPGEDDPRVAQSQEQED